MQIVEPDIVTYARDEVAESTVFTFCFSCG